MRKMFAKRHYEAIAIAMLSERPGLFHNFNKLMQWDQDVKALCRMFARDNATFRPSQFLEACGGLFDV